MLKADIVEYFADLMTGNYGIESWITEKTPDIVFERLSKIDSWPLTKVQLNQLLALGREAPVSDGFFDYYWQTAPAEHPHKVQLDEESREKWLKGNVIHSLEHLRWGLNRLFVDALMFFGNVRSGYRELRVMGEGEIWDFFQSRCFDTEQIKNRGPYLPLDVISKDDRYLISEMACKSFGDQPETPGELKKALLLAWREHKLSGGSRVTVSDLLKRTAKMTDYSHRQLEFELSADSVLDDGIENEKELEEKIEGIALKFFDAREKALNNTKYYLSMVGDLDVYVATSMRTRQNFREMATTCDSIFGAQGLEHLHLRHFDPTLSAAVGHEDKGLIECLMVKCAKALVYCAGEKESYGKDAEAAMALSLGKPVIFLCTEEQRSRFYRDIHPLSRLIAFETGVAVGAIVTSSEEQVSELLLRIFENRMEYLLEKTPDGRLRLLDGVTSSVVRLQTSDQLLNETFWNHYHG